MSYLFTSESVSEGHPDKIADQISDALLDEFLARDPKSHTGIETLVTTGQVVIAGEVASEAYIDLHTVVRTLIDKIGYNRGAYRFDGESCGILNAIHEQSADIAQGVNREVAEDQGAGDQGMMFGYAVNETDDFMPLSIDLAHKFVSELAEIRREGKQMTYLRKGKEVTYLRPDSKSQVTVEYTDDNRPIRVHTLVISTQHDEFVLPQSETPKEIKAAEKAMLNRIKKDVKEILIPRVLAKLPAHTRALFDENLILHVNPTGKFVLGGPHADTGLTGRKIIVDTYGGRGAHGGGAFSGKDPSKVDRSAAYACRHIAKNLVAAGVTDEALVQVAYAIGEARPVSLCVNTFGRAKVNISDAQIAEIITKLFDMRPLAIENRFGLRQPIYLETAAYGHVGRKPKKVVKTFRSRYEDTPITKEVELFAWEKLDAVSAIWEAFGLDV